MADNGQRSWNAGYGQLGKACQAGRRECSIAEAYDAAKEGGAASSSGSKRPLAQQTIAQSLQPPSKKARK